MAPITLQKNSQLLNKSPYCFICRNTYRNDTGADSELGIFSLRLICQYLEVNCDSKETETTKKSDGSTSNVSPDISVLLCSPCAALSIKVSSLIQHLEATQMHLNYQMQKLHEAFNSISIPSDTTVITSSEVDDTSFRKNLTEKCSEEVNRIIKSNPIVLVERAKLEEPIQSHVSDGESEFSEDLYEPAEPEQDYSKTESTEKEDFKDNFPKHPKKDPTNPLVKTACFFYKLLGLPGNENECKSCKSFYKYNRRGDFCDHLAACHPEKIYKHQRLPNVSLQQFEACCKHELNLQISGAKQLKEQNYSRMCPHCKYKCKGSNILRTHLVFKHSEIIQKNILRLQEKENLEQVAKLELSCVYSICENWKRLTNDCKKLFKKDPVTGKNKCKSCGQLATINSPQLHLVLEHPENLFKSCKPKILSKEEFHALCTNILRIEVKKSKEVEENENENKIMLQCHLCLVKISSKRQMLYHLASKHYKILEENLLKHQHDKSLLIKSCLELSQTCKNSRFQTKSNMTENDKKLLNVIKQNVQESETSGLTECLICKHQWDSKLPSILTFSNHFLVFHPEMVFHQYKLQHVADDHFKFCCKHAQSVELSRAIRKKVDNEIQISCPHCSKKQAETAQMRRHIFIVHNQVIGENIINLQNSENTKQLSYVKLPGIRATQERSDCENWKRLKLTCKNMFKAVPDKPSKLECLECKQLAQACNPRLHLVTHHPETLFENTKHGADLTSEEFYTVCKILLRAESNLREKVLGGSGNKTCFYKCHLCEVKSHSTVFLRYHLAAKHFKVMEDKLLQLTEEEIKLLLKQNLSKPNRWVLPKCLTSQKFSAEDKLGSKLLGQHCIQRGSLLKCKICKKVVPEGVTVSEHFVDKHIIEVFWDIKLGSVTRDKFEVCCKLLLNSEQDQARSKTGFQCKYCKTVEIKKCNQFRFHLLSKHFTDLEECLVRLQNVHVWKRKNEGTETEPSKRCVKRRKLNKKIIRANTLKPAVAEENRKLESIDIDAYIGDIYEECAEN